MQVKEQVGVFRSQWLAMGKPAALWEETDKPSFSKIGDMPDVWAGFEWPKSGSLPLQFIAQIDLRELSLISSCLNALPHEGVLYFFCGFSENDEEQKNHACSDMQETDFGKVLYHPNHTELRPFAPSSELWADISENPISCSYLHARQIQSYPNSLERFEAMLGRKVLTEVEREAFYRLSNESEHCGHQMGGYPHPVQEDMLCFTKDWSLLFEFDDEWGGSFYFWIDKKDLACQDFSNIEFFYQYD